MEREHEAAVPRLCRGHALSDLDIMARTATFPAALRRPASLADAVAVHSPRRAPERKRMVKAHDGRRNSSSYGRSIWSAAPRARPVEHSGTQEALFLVASVDVGRPEEMPGSSVTRHPPLMDELSTCFPRSPGTRRRGLAAQPSRAAVVEQNLLPAPSAPSSLTLLILLPKLHLIWCQAT